MEDKIPQLDTLSQLLEEETENTLKRYEKNGENGEIFKLIIVEKMCSLSPSNYLPKRNIEKCCHLKKNLNCVCKKRATAKIKLLFRLSRLSITFSH